MPGTGQRFEFTRVARDGSNGRAMLLHARDRMTLERDEKPAIALSEA
jgi:hypothetical protein